MRVLHHCLGYASVGLAILGLALPLLPTTPFLLAAVWFFARSNPGLVDRLQEHPRLGPTLRALRKERAIPARAKATVLATLAMSYTGSLFAIGTGPFVLAIGGLMGGVTLFILTRPTAARAR